MKRPQGFDRPAPPLPSAERPAAGKPGKRPRRPGASAATSAGSGASAAGAEPITEPIPVQAAATPHPVTIAPVSPLRPGTPSTDPRAGAPLSDPTGRASSAAPSGGIGAATPARAAGQARAQFRAARRARKRYERDEVRRFTWRARRRRRAWLAGIGVAAALALFTAVGAFSPLMALRTIEVTGTSRIPAEQVQAALADQLGTPLPLLDAGKIKAKLARFTLIRSFVTEARPPGTLVVRVVEREPVGVISSAAGFDLVDAAGVVIQSTPVRPDGYPALNAGGVGSPGFRAAAEVVSALPDSIRSQLDTVTAATTDDVTLGLAGGAKVVWGSAEKSDYKAVVLGALMVGHPVGSVDEYDVSSPDSAVLR